MPTTITWKPVLDMVKPRPISSATLFGNPTFASDAYAAYDMRGRDYANPITYIMNTATEVYSYNNKADGWMQTPTGTIIGAGTGGVGKIFQMAPSQGPKGTLTTGNTTTRVVISTALPASVGVNQLSNRGDGKGFILRIIGSAAGSSGKTEERRIIGNTSGTTPTLWLDEALSFTPASGDSYELLAGRIYAMGTGSTAAGAFRYYDIATQSMSGNLSTTNMPSLVATNNNQCVCLDEAYVPKNRLPGEGFIIGAATYDAGSATYVKGCLTATATAAGTITGQASAGDSSVVANEYRNFQIRIVEDTTTPTAVGQRRRITSHTAGTSAVYTLASNWTVTPSSTAKFVIENDNDKMILWNQLATPTYNYNHTANTWDTTTWAARTTGHTMGPAYQNFGIERDTTNNSRHSEIHSFRSGLTLDIFDIAGSATGSWTNGVTVANAGIAFSASLGLSNGSTFARNPFSGDGSQIIIRAGSTGTVNGLIYAYYMKSRVIKPVAAEPLPADQINQRTSMYSTGWGFSYYDNGTYVPAVYLNRAASGVTIYQYLLLD